MGTASILQPRQPGRRNSRNRQGRIRFESYGLRIGVSVNRPEAELLERIKSCLPPGWTPARRGRLTKEYSLRIGTARQSLHADGRYVSAAVDLDDLLEVLEGEIQLFVGEFAKERIFVHAGVVGWRGQAIVLPGRSMAGKSTLVAALLAAGATYFSDEYAVLDADGLVHPYPRRLALRQPGGARSLRPTAAELGAATATGPAPIGAIVVARYQPGAAWQPRLLTRGEAIMELMQNTLPMLSRPEKAMAALERGVRCSIFRKGLRGEAAEAAKTLLHTLESPVDCL